MDLKIEHLGKIVGTIKTEKGMYITRKERSKHYFIKHKGYGISIEVLKKIRNKGIERIILIEINENGETMYETTRQEFFKKGIRHTYKQGDKQLILPIKEWKRK